MNPRESISKAKSPIYRNLRPVQQADCQGRSTVLLCTLVCDNTGMILNGNSQCDKIFGRPIEVLIESNFFDLLAPIARQYLLSVFGPELFKSDGLITEMSFSYPLKMAGASMLDSPNRAETVVLTSRFVRGLLKDAPQEQGRGGQEEEEQYTEAVLIETRFASDETAYLIRNAI